jgi:hypothetical protein
MTPLSQQDIRHVLSRMPKALIKIMKERPIMLAGGAIRSVIAGEPVSDWDLFGPNHDTLDRTADSLAASITGSSRKIVTNNAITIARGGATPVQFITRWVYDAPDELLQSFDFSIARAAIWFQSGLWISRADERFYQDLAARRLTYCSPIREEEAGGSMLRVIKFLRRGYSISPENLALVIDRLMANVHAGPVPRAQVIAGLLREVDPLSLIDGLEEPADDSEVVA